MRIGKMFLLCLVIGALVVPVSVMTASAQEKVFKVICLAPTTGTSAKSGEEIKNAAIMAFDKINYKIGDYKIELIQVDEQGDPAKANAAYLEAVDRKGGQAGFMNWSSGPLMACWDIMNQKKIPHFFVLGDNQKMIDRWNKEKKEMGGKPPYMMTKNWPVPSKLTKGYADAVAAWEKSGKFKPAKKIVALAGEDQDWGREMMAGWERDFKALGWEVAFKDAIPSGQTEFYPTFSKYKQAGVTMIAISTTSVPGTAAFVKQAAETGMNKQALMLVDGLSWTGDWYKLVGKSAEGVVDMMPVFTSKPALAFADEYKKRHGYAPSPSAGGLSYDAANFFIKMCKRSIEKYGKLDSETMYNLGADEILTGKLTFTRAEGAIVVDRYRWGSDADPDPVIGVGDWFFPIIQYKGTEQKVVFPDDQKQADFVLLK